MRPRASAPRHSALPGRARLLVFFTIALGWSAHAQTPAELQEAARQAEILQRQNQERIQRELESARPRERAPSGIDTERLQPKVDARAAGKTCHEIREIVFTGASNLTSAVRGRITQDFAGRCLGVTEIEQILAEVTRDYISRGFVTTRAYLPQQDLSKGRLEIMVLEGVIGKLELDDGGRRSIRLGNVFPSEGELLNLRDLEQGIEQVNRLGSNNARLDILPGDKPGSSDVVIRNEPRTPVHAFLSADNQGTESTGRNQLGATLVGDGLLGLNDLLLYSHRRSQPNDIDRRFSSSDSVSFSVPWRYVTGSLFLSRSRYVSMLALPSGLQVQTKGSSSYDSWRLERVVYRDQSTRVSLAGTLSLKDTKTYIADQFIGVSSRSLTVFDLDASIITGFMGGVLGVDAGYAKGLNFAGAVSDPDDLPDDLPRAQFRKLKFGFSYTLPFSLAGKDMAFSTQFVGQRALDTLYGSEQVLIGGIYSVRGFVRNTLSGDHGYYLRNELSMRTALPVVQESLPLRLYAALDTGEVSNRAPGVPNGRLTGMALGFSVNWRGAGLEVFNARPISFPSEMRREGSQTWLRLSYAI